MTPGQDWAVRDGLSRWWQAGLEADLAGFQAVGFKAIM